ncbi:uncharacterized protein TNIN_248301 [Trichonephila inaurata madagascariensis]|uniref:IRF tryptophan pentad repeat domain-containing protein n=1 Tax=Trichonephila inaurata madagascariensis TaxID=2747483 RepID=A0A8X7CKX4_9ARAC|nr:uncharacterized protein TNIN_248301 [Trichonephila inaurata madagascariensis]
MEELCVFSREIKGKEKGEKWIREKDMKQEKPKKRKPRRSSDAVTRSSVLKYIILCLIKGLHKHVLRWWDSKSKVFEIIFVHKSNNNWNETYLDLFKELDKTSKQYRRYLEEKDYECGCKRRCRANLRKLCKAKIFTEIKLDREKLNVDKSIIIKRYKINIEDFTNLNLIDFEKQLKRNILKCDDTIQGKTVTEIKDTVKSCAQSHCLCLSNLVESAGSRLLDAQNTVNRASISNHDQYAEKSETVGYNEFLFSSTNDINQFSEVETAGIGVMELTNSQNAIDSTSTYNSELNAEEREALRFNPLLYQILNSYFSKLPEVEYTESRLLDARNTVDCASISNHDQYAEKSGTVGYNEFPFSNTNDVHEFSKVEYAGSGLLGARNIVDCASISNHDQYAEKSETVSCNEFTISNTNDIHEFSEVEMAGIGVMELTNSQNTIDSTSTYNSELNAEKGSIEN